MAGRLGVFGEILEIVDHRQLAAIHSLEPAKPRKTRIARLSRTRSSSSRRPTRDPILVFGTVVILSTIKRHGVRRPSEVPQVWRLPSEGSWTSHNGASVNFLRDDGGPLFRRRS